MAAPRILARRPTALAAVLERLPAVPGVYRFRNVRGTVIYVGKSVCLRDRVRSYFAGQGGGTKARRLRAETAQLEWTETGSELEALLLESRQVKELQPRFNTMLKEFVPLPCVRLDLADPYPRLEVTRTPRRDGALYFGPFFRHGTLETAVAALGQALGLRDCEYPGGRLPGRRPCHRYELRTCLAPCVVGGDAGGREAYARAVRLACEALAGEGDRPGGVFPLLEARMHRAAESLRFEQAARLRDALAQLRTLCGRQQVLLSALAELSLVAACPAARPGRRVLFVFRFGRLSAQEEVDDRLLSVPALRRALAERLLAAALHPGPVPAIDSVLLDEVQIVTRWLRGRTGAEGCWTVAPGSDPTHLLPRLQHWLAGLGGASRVAA